jgi:hypothetical protein
MTGAQPTQRELLLLCTKLFNNILPLPTRDEKRSRAANLLIIERFCAVLLPLLANPRVAAAILTLFYTSKRPGEQEKLLLHVLDL